VILAMIGLLTASTLAASSMQDPAAENVRPHASLVDPAQPFNQLSWDDWGMDNPHWVSLRPSWLQESEDNLTGIHAEFCSRVAAAVGLQEEERALLVAATSPHPLVVEYHLMGAEGDLLLGRESLLPGHAQSFADVNLKRGIRDFDVEIASGSGIADPVVSEQETGSSLALMVRPSGDQWLVEVALVRTLSQEGEEVPLRYAQLSGKSRLITQLTESGTSLLLTPDKTASMQLPSLGAGPMNFELRLDGEPQTLIAGLPGGLIGLQLPWSPGTQVRGTASFEQLRKLMQRGLAWTDGRGLWLLSGTEAPALAATLAAELKTPQESWQLHMDLSNNVDNDSLPVSLQAPILDGHALRFAQGTMKDSLVDWDVEVALVARIADPQFHDFFGGVRGNLTPHRLADGRLQLSGEVVISLVEIGEADTIRLASSTPGEAGYEGNVPAAPAQVMGIEHPELRELRFAGTWEPNEEGQIMLVRSASSLLGPGARVKLVLTVSAP